ncbi:MAG: hypothetical protein AAF220_00990 [Pseudomonadota bacterium]
MQEKRSFISRFSAASLSISLIIGLGVAYLTAILVPGANPMIYVMGGIGGTIAAALSLMKSDGEPPKT